MRIRSFSSAIFILAVCFMGLADVRAQEKEATRTAKVGIMVKGWTGKVDAKEQSAGLSLDSTRFAQEGKGLRITTGPAVTYWNPANKAAGDYTVSATFYEPKYLSLNDHPHPYGLMVAGNDLGTDQESYLYCAAYGNGSFIVRGFGPMPFQMNGPRATPDPAVNKAAGPGQPVTQEIAITVKGDKISCAINKKVVATYDGSDVVAAGKLKSTDGVYGIRFAHNTDALVTDLKVSKAP